MPIRVVLDGPSRNALGAVLARGGGFVAGSVLRFLAIAAVWPAVVLTFAVGVWLFGAESDRPPAVVLPIWLGVLAVAIAGATLGSRLQAGNRRMVLYLRRFGDTASTRTVTAAVGRIGGYWRVVTLDDGQVTPVGARGGQALSVAGRWGGRGADVLGAVWTTIKVVVVVLVVAVGGLALLGQRDPLDTVLGWADDSVGGLLGIAYVVLGFCALALVLITLQLLLAPFTTAAAGIAESIRSADRSKVVRIRDRAAVQRARRLIAEQTRKVISARLFVLRVDTAVWRDTVTEFGTDAAVPLIDITEPTEHILWEIDRMRERFGRGCVFVGQYERLGHLYVIPEPGSITERLQQRLDDCEILAYRTSRRGARQFTNALRATLETRAGTRPVSTAGR